MSTPAGSLAEQCVDQHDCDDVAYLCGLFANAVRDEGLSNATVIMALAQMITAMDAANPHRGCIPQALVIMVKDLHLVRVGESGRVGHA